VIVLQHFGITFCLCFGLMELRLLRQCQKLTNIKWFSGVVIFWRSFPYTSKSFNFKVVIPYVQCYIYIIVITSHVSRLADKDMTLDVLLQNPIWLPTWNGTSSSDDNKLGSYKQRKWIQSRVYGILTSSHSGRVTNSGSTSGWCKALLPSARRLELFCDHTSCCQVAGGLFPAVERSSSEGHHLPWSNAKDENAWRHTHTPHTPWLSV
jgi:hypothetical protein